MKWPVVLDLTGNVPASGKIQTMEYRTGLKCHLRYQLQSLFIQLMHFRIGDQ